MKKAQITLFILMGVVILVAVGFMIYLKDLSKKDSVTKESLILPLDVPPIKNYIESCLRVKSKQVVEYTLNKGGITPIDSYPYYINFSNEYIPYYIFNGEKIINEIEDNIEKSISKALSLNVDYCLNKSHLVFQKKFKIDYGKLRKIDTSINKESITIKIELPTKVHFEDSIIHYENYLIQFPSRVKDIINISEYIVKNQLEDVNYILLSDILNYAIKKEMNIELFEYDNDSIIYSIIDNSSKLDKMEMNVLNFGVSYNWTSSITPEKVEIMQIPDLTAIMGYEFEYKVKAIGSQIYFSDNADLFDINPDTGLIKFTPTIDQIGTYLIEIVAQDNENNLDFEIFKLNIKGFYNQPKIDYIGYLTAKVGERFIYDVNATDPDGDFVFFLDNIDLFDISTTDGLIDFVPSGEQIGEHNINITAIDLSGGSDVEEMHIFVIE